MPGPDRSPAQRGTQRWQFRLSYLFYLITLFAIGFALLRTLLAIGGGWLATAVGLIYVSSLLAYFAIRFPILMRRARRSAGLAEARRQQLAEMIAEARRQEADSKENP